MNKPYSTLFLLTSVDGKISTGETDLMDFDKDFPTITSLKEGLQQYYDIEKQTDFYSFISGRVLAKIGINEKTDEPTKTPVSFVVIDNAPHLQASGIMYLAKKLTNLIVVTTDSTHPAIELKKKFDNIHIMSYTDHIDFMDLFSKLASQFHVDRITIQSGGTLNATLIRSGLIDRVLLVVAPALIGGKMTPSFIDGESLQTKNDLHLIKTLELIQATALKHSYVLLEYTVNNSPS